MRYAMLVLFLGACSTRSSGDDDAETAGAANGAKQMCKVHGSYAEIGEFEPTSSGDPPPGWDENIVDVPYDQEIEVGKFHIVKTSTGHVDSDARQCYQCTSGADAGESPIATKVNLSFCGE